MREHGVAQRDHRNAGVRVHDSKTQPCAWRGLRLSGLWEGRRGGLWFRLAIPRPGSLNGWPLGWHPLASWALVLSLNRSACL